MTFWADNIKFIKDISESKYKKIEDAIVEVRSDYTERSRYEAVG